MATLPAYDLIFRWEPKRWPELTPYERRNRSPASPDTIETTAWRLALAEVTMNGRSMNKPSMTETQIGQTGRARPLPVAIDGFRLATSGAALTEREVN
jgi:hypothetical protein